LTTQDIKSTQSVFSITHGAEHGLAIGACGLFISSLGGLMIGLDAAATEQRPLDRCGPEAPDAAAAVVDQIIKARLGAAAQADGDGGKVGRFGDADFGIQRSYFTLSRGDVWPPLQ
jgi:hypothetical protein